MSQLNNYIEETLLIYAIEMQCVEYTKCANKARDETEKMIFTERINALHELAKTFDILYDVIELTDDYMKNYTEETDG